jgi:hypothetical protein
MQVADLKAAQFSVKIPCRVVIAQDEIEPGGSLLALWGTGYEVGRAFVEMDRGDKTLKSFWTGPDRTQEVIEFPVTEDLRGGFTLRVTYVRENRAYIESRNVDVPWSNKELDVRWERFVSKLEPGAKET